MKKEEYKKLITELLGYLDETDLTFMRQIYTLIKKHIEKKGRR